MPDLTQTHQAQHLELILSELESLPTLPAVAVRLLQITDEDESDARQVIQLVASDPALTGKVLAMCRRAENTTREMVTTVDRAVTLLGFKAIRNAVLSIKVLEVFERSRGGHGAEGGAGGFDHAGFWRHSLAVGIAAELIAEAHRELRPAVNPSEAFVCGLLHDLGKLALEHLLPRSYERVVELAERQQLEIAQVERDVIGMDHHTVGKRLGEHWRLPHVLQDVMWLHGASGATLPELSHRRVIEVVGVADMLVRRLHIGFSGNYRYEAELDERCAAAELDARRVSDVAARLAAELERRSELMGLGEAPSQKVLLDSVMGANAMLGRVNEQLALRKKESAHRQRVLEAIVRFHQSAGAGGGVQEALTAVAESAESVLGEGWCAVLYQISDDGPWLLHRHAGEGRGAVRRLIEPPPGTPPMSSIMGQGMLLGVAPWLTEQLGEVRALQSLRVLALGSGTDERTIALLAHDRADLPSGSGLAALAGTWGAAIAAAARHQGARRLGEQLAQAARLIASQQDCLLRSQSLARLGEMAAGAAHEMNNPLAVISGRAQLLTTRLTDNKLRADATVIWHQANRLSDLISALRLFADPPKPRLVRCTAADVLEEAIHQAKQRMPDVPAAKVAGLQHTPYLVTDSQHLSAAIAEVLLNAYQAQPKAAVKVVASVDPHKDRWILTVTDDGTGMDAATLEHAFDPFFSVKPAGRQTGMGLPRAKRFIEGLGGTIELASQVGRGTTATITLPLRGSELTAGPAGEVRGKREGDRREVQSTV
jgi:signal transduction histidine kinase/HD-like signal output (HDOD) protein